MVEIGEGVVRPVCLGEARRQVGGNELKTPAAGRPALGLILRSFIFGLTTAPGPAPVEISNGSHLGSTAQPL